MTKNPFNSGESVVVWPTLETGVVFRTRLDRVLVRMTSGIHEGRCVIYGVRDLALDGQHPRLDCVDLMAALELSVEQTRYAHH